MKYFLIITTILLVTSCSTDEKSHQNQKNITQSSFVSGETQVDFTELLTHVSEQIRTTPEFNACIASSIATCNQSSAMQIARNTNSPEFCDALSNTEQQESCKFAIVMTTVQTQGDIESCSILSEPFQEKCIIQGYRIQAIQAKDISLCDKIPKDTHESDPTLQNNNRSQCVMNVIMSDPASKESDCKKLKEKTLQTTCSAYFKNRSSAPLFPQILADAPIKH